MAKSDLLKEAIADAKAVRETALANAKIALEEAFTPRIQSMLSAKLAEEEEMEEAAEEPVETNGNGMDTAAGAPVDEAEEMEETEDMEEGMHGDEEKNEGMHGDEEVSETEEPVEEEEDLELEAIIKELEEELDDSGIGGGDNQVDQADDHTEDPGEGELTAEGEEDKVEEGEKDDMDEDISLDEIISALREEEEKMDETEEDKMDQADDHTEDPGEGDLTEEKEDMEEEKEDMDEEISLDEIISALKEEEEKMDETEEDKMDEGEKDKMDETEKELEEAYNVIKFMKSKLNEVNLLNAKLLFSNKLFRNHSLNESQKMKVIENFDRAQTLREVKLVFATLSESFGIGVKTKRTIKESYASKSTRSTAPSKKVISEGSDLSARWRKLANL